MQPLFPGSPAPYRSNHRLFKALFLFLLLAAAFALRLGAINRTQVHNPIQADAREYLLYAYNLRTHGIYSRTDTLTQRQTPKPDALRPPGYPLFLWSLWNDRRDFFLWRVTFVQAILDTFTVLLVFLIARRTLSFPWAALATLLTAFSPHLISANTYLLTETLFTFLMMLGLWVVTMAPDRPWLAPAAGAILAAATLTRPTLQFFPLVLMGLSFRLYGRKKGFRFSVGLLLGFLLLFAPWIARNISSTGHATDPRLAVNTLHHGIYPDFTYRKRPESRGFPYRYDPRAGEIGKNWHSVIEEILRRFREEPTRHLYWYAIGKPLTLFSWNILAGMGDIFIYPVTYSPFFGNPIYFYIHEIMHFLHWPIVLLSIIASLAVFAKRKTPNTWTWVVLSSVLLYFILLHVTGAPFPRYSIPLRPILYLLSAWILSTLSEHWKTVDPNNR